MSNKLKHLASQFRDLPNQVELRKNKLHLSTIAKRTEESLVEVREAKQRVIALRDLLDQPTLMQQVLDHQLLIIKRSAQKLTAMVNATTVPETARVSVPLQTVTDAANGLRDAVTTEWATASSGEVESAQAFVALAGMFDVDAQIALQRALDRFRRSVASPPVDAVAMLEYRSARRALLAARDSLSISGPVADVLLRAAKGAANAGDLRDEQVQAFLDLHPVLWGRLRVTLM